MHLIAVLCFHLHYFSTCLVLSASILNLVGGSMEIYLKTMNILYCSSCNRDLLSR